MRILLVDTEVNVLRSVTRLITSEMDDWEVETASEADTALQILEEEAIDVVVSDVRMPVTDGAQLLQIVEDLFPNVLRIVLSGIADRDTVLRAIRPMHQFLCKPCEVQELIQLIQRFEEYQGSCLPVALQETIGKANGIPSPPKIVIDINEELESESSNAESMAAIIANDPMLCAKILQLANSAIFGLQNPILDIKHALSVVGTEFLRAIAISLSLYAPEQESACRISRQIFDHSLEVAAICRNICDREGVDSDVALAAFTGGVLHDVGKVILLSAFGDDYSKLLADSAHKGRPVFEYEMEAFGACHTTVGAYLLETWGLPASLIEAVASHHSLEVCAHASLASQVVYAANCIVKGDTGLPQLDPEDDKVAELLTKINFWYEPYATVLEEPSDVEC